MDIKEREMCLQAAVKTTENIVNMLKSVNKMVPPESLIIFTNEAFRLFCSQMFKAVRMNFDKTHHKIELGPNIINPKEG